MSASVSHSVACLEQGRSTCSVSRPLSVELLAVRWPACLQNQLKVSARIDPSRPLSSSFLLCNACPSVRLTMEKRRESCRSLASSLAKAIENHRQNRSKINAGRGAGAPKIESKSLPGPSRDAPWHPRASGRRLGSASGAPRGVPGAPRERPESLPGHPGTPERATGSAQERAEATKIDAKRRPGAKKSSCSRAVCLRSDVGSIFRRFSSIFGFFAKSANPPKYCACQQKQRFGPSRCESSRSRDVPSKNDENRPQN